MQLSDAISRLSTHDNRKDITIENLDVSIHAIEELTGFNPLSVDKICQYTSKDHTIKLLIDHINNDFPESSTKLPDSIKAYFSFRDELSVWKGVILKGDNRIVIPESLRPQAINILHNKAHLGLSKTLEWACLCMSLHVSHVKPFLANNNMNPMFQTLQLNLGVICLLTTWNFKVSTS